MAPVQRARERRPLMKTTLPFDGCLFVPPPPGASFRHDSEHEKGSRDGKRKSAPKNTARRKIISLKEASHQNKAPKKPGKRLSPKGKAFPS